MFRRPEHNANQSVKVEFDGLNFNGGEHLVEIFICWIVALHLHTAQLTKPWKAYDKLFLKIVLIHIAQSFSFFKIIFEYFWITMPPDQTLQIFHRYTWERPKGGSSIVLSRGSGTEALSGRSGLSWITGTRLWWYQKFVHKERMDYNSPGNSRHGTIAWAIWQFFGNWLEQ